MSLKELTKGDMDNMSPKGIEMYNNIRNEEMQRCSPVEMRKNLQIVSSFKTLGIDFVAIPVMGDEDKTELIQKMLDRVEELENG